MSIRMRTKQTKDTTKIRSVSDPSTTLRVALSLSKGDGSAWGWGPMRIKKCLCVSVGIVIAIVALASPVSLSAAEKYQAYLAPLPHNDETQPLIIGSKGTATATLDGDTLTIAGTFTGLSGKATK